jgi:hypothetical protein
VSAGNGTFTVADTKTLILGQTGASELKLSPHSTAGSELASLINTAGDTDGSDAAGSILLSAVAGGIGLAWADGKDLWAEGGSMMFVANEDKASCIQLHADAGTSQTITIVNDAGTSATEGSAAIQLLASAGGVNIKGNLDGANAVLLTADGGTSATMVMHNDQGSGAASIKLLSDAGGITLSAGGDIVLDPGGNNVLPGSDNADDLGAADTRWRNIYTTDLHLDNTRGNWTIVEEADMLTIRNNITGKWYKMGMTEIDPTGRDEGMASPPTS